MNKKKFLARLITNQKNVKYNDFIALVKAFEFVHRRTDGSHDIFKHVSVSESLNTQSRKGEAKPYQVRQFLAIVEEHNLMLKSEKEEDEDV